MLEKSKNGCPKLFLAPMEGLGDGFFRRAITSIGGFDEACTEFLRVPKNAHVVSLARKYNAHETAPIPQAAQVMGYDPELMAAMTQELVKRGAPRIDLNCGCPSNTVTGRGAGSSLLKEPEQLYRIAKAMVESVDVPVTAKLRSGFSDTALFRENLLAAQEAGIAFLTLHPRTKMDGYGPPARWDLIAEAKSILRIPLVGNGDLKTVSDVHRMLDETGCDAVMIGRGAVINPWIFWEVKASFNEEAREATWEGTEFYIRAFARELALQAKERTQVNKLKQLMGFMFQASERLLGKRASVLREPMQAPAEYLEKVIFHLKETI